MKVTNFMFIFSSSSFLLYLLCFSLTMPPSTVWNYFEKISNGAKVQCNKCQKELSYKNSTSALLNHLASAHKIILPKNVPTIAKSVKRRHSLLEEEAHDVDESSQSNKVQLVRKFLFF